MKRRSWSLPGGVWFGVLLALIAFSMQAAGYNDRLARIRDLISSKELVMIFAQGPDINNQSCYQRIYDLDLTRPGGVDSTLLPKPLGMDSAISGTKQMSVATGHFLEGAYKNFVAAWAGPGNTVTLSIPDIQAGTLSWTTENHLSVQGLASFGSNRKIRVATGDFFGNEQDEFVLAYEGEDTTIRLQVYSFDPGSLTPHPRGSINDEHAMPPSTNLDDFTIVTGDFDGDGYSDIALLFAKPLGGGDWSLYAKIYTVDDQGNLLPRGSQEVTPNPGSSFMYFQISGASGDFDSDAAQEIAFGYSLRYGKGADITTVKILDVRDSLRTIALSDSAISLPVGPELGVAAGDLNRDGRDEVVVATSPGNLQVYSVDDGMVPHLRIQKPPDVTFASFDEQSDSFLALGDMDGDQRDEIVLTESYYDINFDSPQEFAITVFSADSSLTSLTIKGRRGVAEQIPAANGLRNSAIALGDFDGDRVWLGEPTHYRKTGVMQPTVVLYTPPTHYDIFDTTIVDLSGCYPGESCGFSSSYVQSTTIDTTVTTEVHEDWGVDSTLLIQAPAGSVTAEQKYGNHFSREASSSQSYTITTGRIASGDDWLYANVYDLDLYEYPVYNGTDLTPIGHFLVSIPGVPRPLWIESKDDDVLGNLFRPDHEVGNVLSYPEAPGLDTSRVIVNFPEQTIGSTGSSFVSLQQSTFQENNVQSSWDSQGEFGFKIGSIGSVGVSASAGAPVSVGVSASFPIGVEAGISSTYGVGQISTQTVSVGHSLQIESDLGHLQAQYGTSGTYYVKPYAYWTSYGALALDYKVSPLPAGANSFWQARYGGKPDLGFALPWRYDPQKGLPLPNNDPSYVNRTRDVFLSETEPHGGDTVAIYARVRNMSLAPVTTPFSVRIYKNDPASGGTLLGEVAIDTTIPPRSWRAAIVSWAIPLSEDLLSDRIYAVIDPNNAVANEVHENNNTGWAPAVAFGSGVTAVSAEAELPTKYVLYPAYPNPFNPMTTIRFALPEAAQVSIKVYNVLGQEVVTLANEVRGAGTHNVHFNGADLASGVYIYRFEATPLSGGAREVATGKVLLVK